MTHDPFSAVLSLVDARAACAGGFIAGGQWAVRFPPPTKIKFFVIARGECRLAVDGIDTPFHLREGDVFLLAAQKHFTVASALAVPPQDALKLFPPGGPQVIEIGKGDDLFFLGGHVDLDSAGGRLLVDNLPPTIHLRSGCAEAGRLRWLIDQLVQEYAATEVGASFACAGIAQLMFLQILRGHLAQSGDLSPGWLRAIGDPRIAPALRLMHSDPARNWHLPELAKAAGMSRTGFAVHFKAVAGVAPLTYLTAWRMRLAERELRAGKTPISTLARSIGYTSEAAFSNAFKRVTGNAPKRYRTAGLVAAAPA